VIEIRKIYKKDIPALLDDKAFWNLSFLAVSRHRLYSLWKNPTADENDLALLLSYLDDELVGYMGVFIDKIVLSGTERKVGWLSTWWVHPKTKGTGIGREILNTMYQENNGAIGISQFTPSAKRVYDKSGYFTTLKKNIGVKAVLRSNLSFVIPALYPKTRRAVPVFSLTDDFLNFFINCKLALQKQFLLKRLEHVAVEYLDVPDAECLALVEQFNTGDISKKDAAFFEWLKAHNWVQRAPLLQLTRKSRYEFSMYDKDFHISYIKILKDNSCIGFIVLQKRNHVSKVLFTYFDHSRYTDIISDIIKLENIEQNTREIICYEPVICANLRKSKLFLYKTKKKKESIISKVFGEDNFGNYRMQYGDGDCCFA
jgi:GNAT superfamily N-acetyltransferase